MFDQQERGAAASPDGWGIWGQDGSDGISALDREAETSQEPAEGQQEAKTEQPIHPRNESERFIDKVPSRPFQMFMVLSKRSQTA